MRIHDRYRATGATLPGGDLLGAHDVAMEGYFWRVTDPVQDRVVLALLGVNRDPAGGHWGTLGLAGSRGFLALDAHPVARALPGRLYAESGHRFRGDERTLLVDLGPRARLELRVDDPEPWPRRLVGGSSWFQAVPALNQYWHPWLLGGSASGRAVLGDDEWAFDGAQVYAEKNWGKDGFPDSWWWGQAHGFSDPSACVAFAGGQVHTGPFRTEVTGLVVRLPHGQVVRLGNPVTSPVVARVREDEWLLRGRGAGWRIEVEGTAPVGAAHVLPVPLPAERRNTPGALEHMTGTLRVTVHRRGRLLWQDTSTLAALEHGGLRRAAAEMARRGAPDGATGAPPDGSPG